MACCIGLLAWTAPAAADTYGTSPDSYKQPLAAIGYQLHTNAVPVGKAVSATDVREVFDGWRESQRPGRDVYAVLKKAPHGWMITGLSHKPPQDPMDTNTMVAHTVPTAESVQALRLTWSSSPRD